MKSTEKLYQELDSLRQKQEKLMGSDLAKQDDSITPQFLTTKQAATYIGMSENWLAVARKKTENEMKQIEGVAYIPRPKHTQLSTRRTRYHRQELDRWIKDRAGSCSS